MPSFNPCLVIPCYNHGRELIHYLPRLVRTQIPAIVVDDGSCAEEAELIRDACSRCGVQLERLPDNKGKWEAVAAGMRLAAQAGYTHVLQCDADGQHNPDCIADFITTGQNAPEHMVVGQPRYGADVPRARLHGRKITNFFTWLETAGACRCDAMCGFRLYPLERSLRILKRHRISPGMPGDIEMLVRCYWDGMPITSREVDVCYPEGGRSNFRMLRDNALISWAHTKLCISALLHPWRLVRAHKPQ